MAESAVKKRTELRYDRGELTFEKGQDGFKRFNIKFARTGVFPYVYQDGTVRKEAKLPEELFSTETIESAKGKPFTDGHVPLSDSKGLVTPANYLKYTKGALGDSITVQDGHLCGVVTLFDAALTARVEKEKKVEVSIGFELDIDPTPGELDGEKFDSAQRNIRINHVAAVDHGRAGESVHVQADSAPEDIHIAIMQKGDTMPKKPESQVRVDSTETKLSILERVGKLLGFDSAEETPPADANKPAEGAKPKDEEAAKQIADLTAQVKALTEKNAELTEALKDANNESAMDSKLAKRSALIDAAKIIIPDVKIDGLSDREIKLRIIAEKLPFAESTRQDSISDVSINARFDAALELARKQAADEGLGISVADVRSDEKAIEDGKKARAGAWDEAEKARAKK